VLFADLVGFTPFAEERDAEDVRDVLTRYFALATDVIGRYGGTVEKFIGDAVMAVWGAPTAQEDDAERAVRAALELVDAVRELRPGIEARAGVLTGEAAVTLGATNQGMVAGDLVNTAARLQSIALPGWVLVGSSTHRAASSAIAFEEVGEQALKGKASPVPAWRALRVVGNRGGEGRRDLPEPPFVGRDEELRLLKDLVSAGGRDRRARLASITGPGGIGKSRLAWELEKWIDGLVETVYWHRGRSPAYGDGITFWALGEMVRRRAGLAETDDETTTRDRISATVAEFVPDESDRGWVEPALLTLLGLEPAPAGGRDALFAAWRIFFERVAANGTTILLFEDLQWADSGLLDFIDHLLEWSKGVPILVVTLARPELFDKRPGWGTQTRNFSAVALQPLPDEAMRALLEGFVPGLPASATEAILKRADGTPLYAVEMVRALVADGRLEQIGGAYRPVGELGDLAVPETLRSLIASRLDALDPADRTLIQEAAVLGQTFTLAGLSAVNGRDEADIEARLRVLVRRELLELEVDPRSPERGQYGFVQSLIREVAYGTLARPDRRARHLAAARFFEALGEDELAGALASHYVAAYQASTEGPEANAIAIQARLALTGAAERAATLGAHDQAVAYLRQAIEVTTDPADRAPLLERAALSATDASAHDAAKDLARAAITEYESVGDLPSVLRTTSELGAILINAQETHEAREILESALADLPETAPDEVRARLLTSLSRVYMRIDLFDRAVEVADRALPLAERLGLDEVVADAFNNKASSLAFLGRSREARALMEAAIAIAHDGGYIAAELRARSNLSSTLWSSDPRRSHEMQVQNFELARRVGNRQMANWIVQSTTSGTWLAGGDWDRAMEDASEALATTHDLSERAGILGAIRFIRISRGEATDDVLATLTSAAEQLSDPVSQSLLHSLRSDHALIRGDLITAYDELIASTQFLGLAGVFLSEAAQPAMWLRDAARLRHVAERLEALPDAAAAGHRARLASIWAGVAGLEGRRPEAATGFREAIARYREFGQLFEVARRQLEWIVVVGADAPETRAAADEARATFERLGAKLYLDRLDIAIADGARSGATARRQSGDPTPEPAST
jgi:class 3 adenylate cyclase/tetratricopeptide (TPR) repeat protein